LLKREQAKGGFKAHNNRPLEKFPVRQKIPQEKACLISSGESSLGKEQARYITGNQT
jgi:hypothetical protein